jgi:copper(I)-binding protein
MFTLAALISTPFAYATIDIDDAYARATPPNATTSAVFATINNDGDKDRVIVKAVSDASAAVELHDVIMNGEVMQMRQVESITIPANGSTVLKPGSLHIMLLDIKEPMLEGSKIDVELTFANGEIQALTVPIKKVMAGMKKMDHSNH